MSEDPCTKLGAELSGYHDGALDEATRRQVESHLQICAVCRARLADYARVDRAVASLGAPVFEDRLREDLVAYTRATIADRGRQIRRERQLARLRSWRTLVPLAAAAGVAVLVIKLTDGGFQPTWSRRAKSPAAVFQSDVKTPVEAERQPAITGSEADENAKQQPATGLGPPEAIRGQAAPRAETPPAVDEAPRADAKAKPDELAAPPAAKLETAPQMADKSGQLKVEDRQEQPAGGVTPPAASAPLAKDMQEKSAGSPSPAAAIASTPASASRTRELERAKEESLRAAAAPTPPPAAQMRAPFEGGRGHLDPQAALSIATLALEVGDLTGARLALADLPTLPADSLTAQAAVLALTLAERTRDVADCKAARERADALVEAAPSSALADTLRVRRAGLPCPH